MTSSPGGTQAVDRAAALVDLVVRADEPVSFTELSDETGLARSTTSRLLAALERTDLVERDPSGGYVAGPLFALHAALHDPWPQVARLARPVLERIGERTGETVHLGVPSEGHVVYIAKVESPQSVRLVSRIGARVELIRLEAAGAVHPTEQKRSKPAAGSGVVEGE